MLSVVFLDAAGTLIETRAPAGHIYAEIAREHGVIAPPDAVHQGFRRAFDSTPGLTFGPGHPAAQLRRLEREWWRAVVLKAFAGLGQFDDFEAFFSRLYAVFADPRTWRADPEARALLERLKKSGATLGVISNFDHRLYGVLEGLGLLGYFDSVTVSSEAGYAKPAREIFIAALARHRAAPDRALHAGDSPSLDVAGARGAGLYAALLDRAAPAALTVEAGVARVGSLGAVYEAARRFLFS